MRLARGSVLKHKSVQEITQNLGSPGRGHASGDRPVSKYLLGTLLALLVTSAAPIRVVRCIHISPGIAMNRPNLQAIFLSLISMVSTPSFAAPSYFDLFQQVQTDQGAFGYAQHGATRLSGLVLEGGGGRTFRDSSPNLAIHRHQVSFATGKQDFFPATVGWPDKNENPLCDPACAVPQPGATQLVLSGLSLLAIVVYRRRSSLSKPALLVSRDLT